jgi:hypothetical protein
MVIKVALEDIWAPTENSELSSTNPVWYRLSLETELKPIITFPLPEPDSNLLSDTSTHWLLDSNSTIDALSGLFGILDENMAADLEKAIRDFRRESEEHIETRIKAMMDDSD